MLPSKRKRSCVQTWRNLMEPGIDRTTPATRPSGRNNVVTTPTLRASPTVESIFGIMNVMLIGRFDRKDRKGFNHEEKRERGTVGKALYSFFERRT